jgi:hypothetical protein
MFVESIGFYFRKFEFALFFLTHPELKSDRDLIYELFGRGHGLSKLRSMLLVMVICNLVEHK